MSEITRLTVAQLAEALAARKLSSREITAAYIESIEKNEPKTGAYITVCAQQAQSEAAAADEARLSGQTQAPLAGVPAALKDNICKRGIPTTCASKMLAGYISPYDAAAAEKLAACPLLGKTNMDEFAMGSSTENSAFHITHNPRVPGCVPGGSSGGSAAAVAANEAPFALGSDTGGSIRQPASFCGVVGLKPTYGTVSRYGLVAFASSLDQIGPITKTVADAALVLESIAGKDSRDATSRESEGGYGAEIGMDIKGLRIAVPKEYFAKGLSGDVKEAVLRAGRLLEDQGARLVEASMPSAEYALAAYYVISSAEASSNLARYDGVKYGYRAKDAADIDELYKKSRSEGFGAEVKRRIMLGTFALSAGYYDAYYKKALDVRSLVKADFARMFAGCDAVLSPVAPNTAYKIGEKAGDPLSMYMGDVYTVPVNIAGLPAISVPGAAAPDGAPVGIQLIGRAQGERRLLRIAHVLEQCLKGGSK